MLKKNSNNLFEYIKDYLDKNPESEEILKFFQITKEIYLKYIKTGQIFYNYFLLTENNNSSSVFFAQN